jgi:hypothetical protein
MKRSMLPTSLVMPALLYLPFHHTVQAYIDWGSGSVAVMALVGALTAVLAATKLYWTQIKTFVRNRFSKSKKSEETTEQKEQ